MDWRDILMKYEIKKTNVIDPDVTSPEWDKANLGKVDNECWEGYATIPETTFKILKGPEGFSVLMNTNEKNLRSECKKEDEAIHTDSCMEFFMKPDPWDLRYLNFETNPNGVMKIGLGTHRDDRILLDDERSKFSIVSIPEDGNWTLKFYIPDEFIKSHFKKPNPVFKGNFYKCGEGTDHSHFGTWSRVHTPNPDYHLTDFFGMFEIEK